MCSSVFVIFFIIIGSAFGIDENQARIRFYYNSMDNYTELFISEAEKIFSTSWYDKSRKTVMFCHGFTGYPKGPAVTAVITAYLSLGHYNVALLNWEKLAAITMPSIINSFMYWALPNSIQLGIDYAETMLRMSAAGLNVNKTHLVGHSLGAHVFGIAGNKMLEKGVPVPTMTALDPAIGFDMKPAFLRLGPTSAHVVCVVHTDPNKYGSKKELGVIDLWPNFKGIGNVLQPGCPKKAANFSDEEFCSHNRAWQYYTEAIMNPGRMLGSHAKNFRIWKRYTEKQRREKVLDLGICDENAVPGNYYFTTAADAPYGLGEKGL